MIPLSAGAYPRLTRINAREMAVFRLPQGSRLLQSNMYSRRGGRQNDGMLQARWASASVDHYNGNGCQQMQVGYFDRSLRSMLGSGSAPPPSFASSTHASSATGADLLAPPWLNQKQLRQGTCRCAAPFRKSGLGFCQKRRLSDCCHFPSRFSSLPSSLLSPVSSRVSRVRLARPARYHPPSITVIKALFFYTTPHLHFCSLGILAVCARLA